MVFRHKTPFLPAIFFALFFLTGCDHSTTGPENEEFFPSENLEAIRQYAMDDHAGRALLIWHDGEMILEEYDSQFDGHQLHPIFSGSKSLAGLLAAIAVKNGQFTFDTTLGELIPEWDPESERGKITVRQLLNLTSGIETTFVGDFNQTAEEWLAADMAFERGTTFTYGPTPFYILSWIFMETFQINPISYLDTHLFSPLGVVRGNWSNIDFIYPNLSFGCSYPALDWLQIGIMLMNKGSLNGIEIIPENLLDQLLQPSAAAPGYGITFWLNKPVDRQGKFAMSIPGAARFQNTERVISDVMPDDFFMMAGAFGQKLYIAPSLRMVIVRYGFGNINDNEFFSILMDGVDQSSL